MSTTSKPRINPPSLLACITCRKRHLKCDARMPICSRCDVRQLECIYVESKRGYKGPRRNEIAKDGHRPLADADEHLADSASASQHSDYPPPAVEVRIGGRPRSHTDSTSTTSVPRDVVVVTGHHISESTASSDDLIDLYYKFFFPAHPFLIPRKQFLQHPDLLPEYLRAVMRFVGSQYQAKPTNTAGSHRHDVRWFLAANMILADSVPNSGFKVQGLMLFAMALFARFEQDRGAEVLEKAIDSALELGMNRESFCQSNDRGSFVLRESWRRTWWDLYIVDGLLSAMGDSQHVSRLRHMAADVCLPGSCVAYSDCKRLRASRTLDEMQHRSFSDDDYPWSSFAYKVEAMRIMSTVLALGADTSGPTDPEVEVVDASISNFMLSLPPGMRDVVEKNGVVDEILFAAHMIINWAAILLHRPRSNFIFIKNHYSTACTREESTSLPALSYSSHAAKAIRAANALSTLSTIHPSLAHHTPCYACAVALSTTVHLPAYALAESPQEAHAIKERLQLSISTLANIGEVWPLARVVKTQVMEFAHELFMPSPSTKLDGVRHGQTPPVVAVLPAVQQVDFDAMLSNEEWLEDLCTFSDVQNGHAHATVPIP